MMDEEMLDAALERLAKADRVESRARVPGAWAGVAARRRRDARRRQWVRIGVGLAATLVVGIGIGRWSGGGSEAGDPPHVASSAAWSPMLEDLHVRSRTLLQHVAATDPSPPREWHAVATELLWVTRRLLDDPAPRPAAEHALLDDLETVLAQLLDVRTGEETFELDLVREAIAAARLLDRLAVRAPAVPS